MNDYYNADEIDTAVINLATKYPGLAHAKALPHPTAQGRICHALYVGLGVPGSKAVVMIVGGAHGFEWGSSEIALNLAAALLESLQTQADLRYSQWQCSAVQVQDLLENLHLVIFPLVNPDGRVHSQTIDGVWRKNRNPAYSRGDPTKVGVDVNRNFDFLFDFKLAFAAGSGVSTSSNMAEDVYQGPAAFSEAETQNVRWLLDTFTATRWFIDLHSAGNTVLHVWGHDQTQTTDKAKRFDNPVFDGQRGLPGPGYLEYMDPADLLQVQQLGQALADNLQQVRDTTYQVKPAFENYGTSGASHDYVYSRPGVGANKSKVLAFVVEWGSEQQPDFPEMSDVVKEVTAGLIGFCRAASQTIQ